MVRTTGIAKAWRIERNSGMRWSRRSLGWLLGVCLVASSALGGELKKETLKDWDDYIQASSLKMHDRMRPDSRFLWVDEVPDRNRQVRAGKILVSPAGPHIPKPVTNGLIHDWIGASFIPGAKLEDVFSVVRDYDRYKTFYPPSVTDSKSLSADGPTNKFTLLLVNKEAVAKTALESEYEACYLPFAEKQWYGMAYSTRVQEIRNFGHPSETKLPPDEGTGYIWRIYSLARFEERDGGVYMELEAMALSRDIPVAVRWAVDPIVRRVSKNALITSLRQTSEAVRAKQGLAQPPFAVHAVMGTTCSAPATDSAASPPITN
jgi:hypothetical protein